MRRYAVLLLCVYLIGMLAGCSKKETLPDPADDAKAFYLNEIKNFDSQLVQTRLESARLGESIKDYPELEDLFEDFIKAYLNGIVFEILQEETVILAEEKTAQLIVEVSCFSPQALYDQLNALRDEKYDEIMMTGIMPDDEDLQAFFFIKGTEMMNNNEAQRIESGFQNLSMEYDEKLEKWKCVNGEKLIENLLP